jgi:uncharacterized protein YjbI with pentapeptide repeats
MCVLSASVGAGAATLVTSAQIKDGTIVSVDVKKGGLTGRNIKSSSLTGAHLKNGSVTGADLKDGSVTGADVKDGSLTGADLADGTVGAADLEAAAQAVLDDRIPSGRTVTGVVYFDTSASGSGDYGVTVSLPARAHASLTNSIVNFRTDDSALYSPEDADHGCTGSANAPSAPAGRVCVYHVTSAEGTTNVRGAETYGRASDRDFAVRWNDAGGDVYLTAVWAYTAP